MKRSAILILLILIIPTISAIDITLSKEIYQPRETVQMEITGNFLDNLDESNIFLYKEGTPRSMPAIKGLTKQGFIYYVYIILPNQEGNFSLHIEDARYTESGKQKTDTIIKEFKVEQTGDSALSINPGFISTTEDFSIQITSLYSSQEINAELTASEQSYTFFLPEDIEEELDFSIQGLETQQTTLAINNYNVPVFIFQEISEEPDEPDEPEQNQTHNACINETCTLVQGEGTDQCLTDTDCTAEEHYECSDETCTLVQGPGINQCSNDTNCTTESPEPGQTYSDLIFNPDSISSLSARITPNEDYLFKIILENIGTEDLENIEISSDFPAKIKPTELDLDAGEQETIEIIINLDEDDVNEKNRIQGEIIASTDDLEFIFPVFIELTQNRSEVVIAGASTTYSLHCSEIGEICTGTEECDGTTEPSLEGSCCTGTCKPPKKPTSKWLIGALIILIVLVLAGIIYIRAKRKTTSADKILENRKKKFEQRMKPKEVSGGLGKI